MVIHQRARVDSDAGASIVGTGSEKAILRDRGKEAKRDQSEDEKRTAEQGATFREGLERA